ncbi:Rv0361 family membrane protein [Mycobacterium botniense]|uniref:Membrane protein n=1 Tax=Mycobacterium botniense TaxID=84962 RepID=A0A7I9XU50_9MYCO|nr:hypothetical protein [Mycobacterium botniense]GFG73529.1 membrane protein [Mycobacterium botniense]
MANPSEPDRDEAPNQSAPDPDATANDSAHSDADPVEQQMAGADETTDETADDDVTEHHEAASADTEPATEVIAKPDADTHSHTAQPQRKPTERRFTAPGFDAKETTVIKTPAEPATEVLHTRVPHFRPKPAMPQLIPPRLGKKLRPSTQRNWGWVLALILVILALAAIAVLGTVLLTRSKAPKASPEEQVRTTIQNFDIAVQKGDLAALRSITCGAMRDTYVGYDEHEWSDTYRRVAEAKQYPVVASIDQVVVNKDHAEANVTAFMAYDPQIRSTRSFDLQFRDDQWKICQSTAGN